MSIIVSVHRFWDNGVMAHRDPSDIEVNEFAGQLFFRLWRAAHTSTARALESLGLTTTTFAVLTLIAGRDGTIQQQLSTDMGIDPSAMVKIVNQLEDAGLAGRRRRLNDRRAWEVTITPQGRDTLHHAKQLARDVEDDLLNGLTADERDQLLALLRRALASAPTQPPWRGDETDPD
jgi:DNA-binding MarR family transcriptional regulator